MVHRKATYYRAAAVILTLLFVLFYGPGVVTTATATTPATTPAAALTAAWQQAQARGAYHFTSDVTQTTVPAATIANIGSTSRAERLYLEGQTDPRRQTMALKLWSDGWAGGGSTLIPESGIQVQVADGKTQVRRAGGPWEEAQGLVEGFAPQGDFLAFLHAATAITAHEPETRQGVTFTRYTFQLDGPAFARYTRDQMQQTMHTKGELPPEMNLAVSPYYEGMTGSGELWIGADGLPLRQILQLTFPPQNQAQVHAAISTTFADFAQPSAWAVFTDPTMLANAVTATGRVALALTVTLAGCGALLFFRRKRLLQTGLAIVMSLLLVIGPMLSAGRTVRFINTQTARAAAQTAQQKAQDELAAAVDPTTAASFDPHADQLVSSTAISQTDIFLPLVSAANQTTALDASQAATLTASLAITEARLLAGVDTDKDGLSDEAEGLLESNINDKDTDKDGLSDYQELYLDTELLNKDTDGDQLTDLEELKGYLDGAGKRWFSDPTKADSNRDGISDQLELGNVNGDNVPDLVDTDGDKNPDLYDPDNDNDGVIDRLDLSPFTLMGTTAAPFSAVNPFRLTLNDLQPNAPTFVDIQLRPTAADHLWYAFNVLDWPSDRDGNVQDWDNATFATAAQANSPAGQLASIPASENYGDMRLLPLLEISIPGNNPSLPPMSDLLAYNVIVRDLTSDGTATGSVIGKLLYVPLALETNEQTGEQVAFRARIPYLGGAVWGNAHEMRVVWSVQVLMDFPCDPTDDLAAKQGCIPNSGKSALLFALPPSLESDLAAGTVSGGLIQAFIDQRIALQAPAKLSVVKAGQRWELTAGVTLLGGKPNPNPTVYVIKKENGALNLYLVSPSLIRNSPQVVQTYPEEWVLTGVSVREDHGVKMAVIYEDPAVDDTLQDNTALWPLAQGLDETFLTGADRDQNGQTDLTVNELARRFDRLGNGGVSEDERWGIDNILRVERAGLDFPHMDRAVATIAMTTTKVILNNVFSPRWSPSVPLTPTLMFANETTYRGVGLDGLRNASPYLAVAGSALTVDLTPNGGTPLAPETVHSLKWSLYCATSNGLSATPTWRECAGQQVWEATAQRFAAVATEPGDSAEIGRGRLGFIQLATMTLANGVSSVVKSSGVLISNPDALSDSLLRQQWQQAKAGTASGKAIANLLSLKFDSFKLTTAGKAAVLRQLGVRLVPKPERLNAIFQKYGKGILGKISSKLGSTKGWVNKRVFGFAVLLVLGSIAFGIAARFIFKGSGTAAIVSAAVSLAVTVVLTVLQPIVMTWRWSTQLISATVSRLAALGTVLKGSAALVGTARAAAKLGVIVGVLAVWGFFIYSVATGDVPSGGPEFGAALAGAIATTIFLVALALLSLLPGGVILAGILALIDGIMAVVCAIQGTEQQDCFSISGTVIAFVADLFYGFELMINVNDPNLVRRGDPKITLRTPTLGYIAANTFNLSLPVTTTITHVDPDSIAMESYTELFSMNNLRSTTFSYSLTISKTDITVGPDQMFNDWRNVRYHHQWEGKNLYTGYAVKTVAMDRTFAPGINQRYNYFFNTGYSVPAYECWWIVTVPYCEDDYKTGNTSAPIDGPLIDVFPSSVDAFAAYNDAGSGGRRLAWDAHFGVSFDSDGDGLVSPTKGGIDPNDGRWDSDGDGLSDRFEMEQRQLGLRFSPVSPDGDNDGLFDGEEAAFGTDPALADTDGDGLRDSEEIYRRAYTYDPAQQRVVPVTDGQNRPVWTGGWVVNVAPAGELDPAFATIALRVASDPNQADPDGDGIPDAAEARLNALGRDPAGNPYHPQVFNTNPLQVFVEADTINRFVMPNQTVPYTTTVVAQTNLGPGLITITTPPQVLAAPAAASGLTWANPSTTTFSSLLAIKAVANGQVLPIRSTASAQLAPIVPGSQPLINSAGLSLTVDTLLPVTTIGLYPVQYFQAATAQNPASQAPIRIIGGSSTDAGVGVHYVYVTFNGSTGLANGAESWSYALTMPTNEGSYPMQAAALDLLGNRANDSSPVYIVLDGTPPQLILPSAAAPLITRRNANGSWSVALRGGGADPVIGNLPGSGLDLASVEVLMEGASVGAMGWQPPAAIDVEAGWRLDYVLPQGAGDPTDTYTVTVRAKDQVGNLTEQAVLVQIKMPRVEATTAAASLAQTIITQPVTLAGTLTSTTGIAGVQAAFIPIDQLTVISDTVVHLALDEAQRSLWFQGGTIQQNDGRCPNLPGVYIGPCVDLGYPGVIDRAARFDGIGLEVPHNPSIAFADNTSFNAQAWIKTAPSGPSGGGIILAKRKGTVGFALRLDDAGNAVLNINGVDVAKTQNVAILTDEWTHIAAVFNRTRQEAQLYVNGIESAYGSFTGSIANTAPLEIGYWHEDLGVVNSGFRGLIDEVIVGTKLYEAAEVTSFNAAAQVPWQAVTITDKQEINGLTTAKWQLTVPQGIEGFYQIDLRVVDGLGVDSLGNPDAQRANHQRLDTVWRGVIDTLAPRLIINGAPSGITQPMADPLRYEMAYTITADDLHLDQASFKSSCAVTAQAVRGYLTTPWQRQLFPDLTIRNHLAVSCRLWAVDVNATQAAVCDIYGNCSTVNHSVPPQSIPAQQSAPVIISPLVDAIVPAITAVVQAAAANALQLNIQVAAASPAGLKEIVISANGQVVKTLNYTQSAQITQQVETVSVNLPGEGQYQLGVQSTDWAGNVQANAAPPTFTFDAQAPTITLLTDVLTAADTYGIGSGIMRFHGSAGDSIGLAAVQIQVDGGPFQDVTLRADGTWSTAIYLGPNPYGKTYQITVQAIDQAGQRTSVTKAVLVNITAPVESDPLPTPQPGETPIATAIPTLVATATPVPTATPAPTGLRKLYLPIIRR